MKKRYLTLSILASTFAVFTIAELSLALDITINDDNPNVADPFSQPANEDGEVEPGMQTGQKWDLEAFRLDGFSLSVIGGFDFLNGTNSGGHNYGYGDIFIDIDKNAIFGDIHHGSDGVELVNNNYGFDYVIDLDFSELANGEYTYNVYTLNDNTWVQTAYEMENQGSNPWRYSTIDPQGNTYSPTPFTSGTFVYTSGLTDGQTGFTGGDHYMLSGFDLSFLGAETTFTVHTTMECGNDNLMGYGQTPVPEPDTMLLFGAGLAGLAGISRRRKK